MEKLKVAIVGYGGMGSFHAQQLIKDSSVVEVQGVFDISEIRQQVARENGYTIYTNLQQVLEDEQVHVVLIATPNDSHQSISIEALRSGKHVICEKPVTVTSSEMAEIMETAEQTGRVFMVHQNRRWDKDFQMIKDAYDTNKLGDVFQLESRVQGANGIPGDWRHLKEQGGGMLFDWGVHLLDQLLFMVDSPLVKVSADLSFVLGNDVDDGFISYLTFENGLKAIIEVGTTNYLKLPRWYIKGTNGTAIIHDWDLKGEMVRKSNIDFIVAPKPIKAGQGLTKTMAPPSEESVIKEDFKKIEPNIDSFYMNFAKVVAGEASPIVKNEEVYQVMKVIEAIFEAAETGRSIELMNIQFQ